MSYKPQPLDTSRVDLDAKIEELREKLAENTHDVWAQQRIHDGWRFGPRRDDARKEHPSLVPYPELSESEKEYDRKVAMESIKAIMALGYRIERPAGVPVSGTPPVRPSSRTVSAWDGQDELELRELLDVWHNRELLEWAYSPATYIYYGERFIKAGEPLIAYDILSEGLIHARANQAEITRMHQLLALALARGGATLQANQLLRELRAESHLDEETLGILARTHKDLAFQSTEPLERRRQLQLALDIYREAYQLTGGYWTGINTATISLMLGQREQAVAVAQEVRGQCLAEIEGPSGPGADRFWPLATLGEAALVLNDFPQAEDWYGQAAEAAGRQYGVLSSMRRNARLVVEVLHGDWQCIDRCLPVPGVAVFSGHMIDHPARPNPRFPPQLETSVRQALRERLSKLKIGIGYSSAASGSDVLFLEALLEFGAEAHVILPYEREAFVRDTMELVPGADWGARIEKVLELATEVVPISSERLSSGSTSYEYANLLLLGLAATRAEQLDARLVPVAVWDGKPGDGPGGTASSIDRWRSLGYDVEIIHLDQLLQNAGLEVVESTHAAALAARTEAEEISDEALPKIVALMFADAKGFSKLTEDQTRLFVRHFLSMVGELAHRERPPGQHSPVLMNTWGDGLFFVFDNMTDAAEFSLELCDRVRNTAWNETGLPNLGVRIGLHAGPAFPFTDPVTQRPNFIGPNVSQAARIEPITPLNQVYASQHFAALASAERGKTFTCEYVGHRLLAKDFGKFPLYHVRRWAG